MKNKIWIAIITVPLAIYCYACCTGRTILAGWMAWTACAACAACAAWLLWDSRISLRFGSRRFFFSRGELFKTAHPVETCTCATCAVVRTRLYDSPDTWNGSDPFPCYEIKGALAIETYRGELKELRDEVQFQTERAKTWEKSFEEALGQKAAAEIALMEARKKLDARVLEGPQA